MNSIVTMNSKAIKWIRVLILGLAPGLVFADDKNHDLAASQNQAPAAVRQYVSYITVRNKTDEVDPQEMFGDERNSLRAGQCVLTHTPLGMPKSLIRNGWLYIPDNKIELEGVDTLDTEVFWRDLTQATQGQRPLLYLHGYNTSFAKSCEQASLFQANLKLDKQLLLFGWPSDGALLNYARDESDLYWSVAPLEATLIRMIEQFGAGGFDVIAHSLGARGLFLALVQLAHGHHDSLPLLNQLVFVAPDIDAGVFKQYLPDIQPLARNISLYVSDNDKPLALSHEVHGYPRLGQSGAHLNGLKGIEIIDISDIGVRSFSGHLYHLYHESVAHDLDLLLNHGVHAGQRIGLSAMADNSWRLSAP